MTSITQKIIFAGWIVLSLGVAFVFFQLTPVASGPAYRQFEIAKGAGFQGIAEDLYARHFIRSPRIFMAYGVLTGVAHRLKPGEYVLSAGSSTPAIMEVITNGPALDVGVTFPEGATLKDMGAILAQNSIIAAGSLEKLRTQSFVSAYPFLKGASGFNGFLFPDTYRFFASSSPAQVMEKLLDNFAKKAQPLLSVDTSAMSEYELLTVASLLEKEAPDFSDRQIIAGIIYRRLAIGIALQIDATLTYAKCAGTFLTCSDPKVYRKDLQFNSPYNTYRYNGLPPGPIGNPGVDAITAALNPVKSEYLYYLSDPKTDKIIFSKTLEEQNANRAKYLGV